MRASVRFLVLASLILAVVAGCTPKNARDVGLSGKVLYKGAPVTGGNMTLYVGDAAYPVGLNADGTYSVTQLPEGDAVATVDNSSLNPDKPKYGGGKGAAYSPPPSGKNVGPAGKYVKIPPKYKKKETSDLKVTLKNGKMEHDFVLKD